MSSHRVQLFANYSGTGPFPAVIDMFGAAGGQQEWRSSLLASRGFLTLALAYRAYKDLPKTRDKTDVKPLDYLKVSLYYKISVYVFVIIVILKRHLVRGKITHICF